MVRKSFLIKYLSIIPARRNSQRIKRKNILKIKNKELIRYTIESAIKSNSKKNIWVSSDDEKIKAISKEYNINFFQRSKKTSSSSASTESVIEELLLKKYGFDYDKKVENIIILQPTSPLRNFKHIREAIKYFVKKKYDSIFSGYLSTEFVWKNENKLNSLSYDYKNRKTSQKLKSLLFENGAIYIFKSRGFKKQKNRLFGKIGFYKMPKNISIDLDTLDDVKFLKKLI